MKLGTFLLEGQRRVGRLAADASAVDLFSLAEAEAARGVLAVIEREAAGCSPPAVETRVPLGSVSIEAPLPVPRRALFCIGKNYAEHISEIARAGLDNIAAGDDAPPAPIVFSKLAQTVIGPAAPIRIDPAITQCVDYEAELAVVIGRGGRGISALDAFSHVFGYTIVNDVTARDLQQRHRQWLIGKSLDTFCPMGPWIVTADELDPSDLAVRCWVNGELRQEASTRELLYDIPTLVASISAGITLLSGDVIATGTPAGVGAGFDPPRYLRGGDTVRIVVGGIGELSSPVVTIDRGG